MKIGTKSLLFGAHAFWLHPFFVALAWWKLYGFPWDPRLWFAFFLHDIGYWGCFDMDGEDGERHPYLGALHMWKWFDHSQMEVVRLGPGTMYLYGSKLGELDRFHITVPTGRWYKFCLYHSRTIAKQQREEPSLLSHADKFAQALTPWWIYLPMVRFTGEISEYQHRPKHVEELGFAFKGNSWFEDREWYRLLQRRRQDDANVLLRNKARNASDSPSQR